MSSLHTPITIGNCVIRNRLYRAPVLEGAGGRPDGPEIYRHAFEENARAGVGLIIQGNSCITDEGRSAPGMSQVDTRARTLALSEVTKAIDSGQLRPAAPAWITRAVWAQLCGLASLHERGDLCANPAVLRDEWVGAADRLLYGLVPT